MTQIELENKLGDKRLEALQGWFRFLSPQLSNSASDQEHSDLSTVSGDASFRRYFRGWLGGQPYILVDAPPDKEDNHTFVRLAEKFLSAGVNVPVVFAVDYELGFMCLSDMGNDCLWTELDFFQQNESHLPSASHLYSLAFTQLLKVQACPVGDSFALPTYDRILLHKEMSLFKEWFCEGLLGLTLSSQENELIEASFEFLIQAALSQPQVCVHRDYHSRNLLYRKGQDLGVIDFQDAVLGPFSYDLVSLLKDCYIAWPKQQVDTWAVEYAHLALEKNIIAELDEESFLRGFDLMGAQRHLKVLGIFSRLFLRDKRLSYLSDIPCTLKYLSSVVKEEDELKEFSAWLESNVVPIVEHKISLALSDQIKGAKA